MADWLALCVGNSRYHWGWFDGDDLVEVRDSDRLEVDGEDRCGEKDLRCVIPWEELANRENQPLICLASVVPQQTQLWRKYPNLREITLKDIPLKGLYPTMGIDRALAVYGASQVYGAPVLVIDAGTALTFTGVNAELELVGGAILPGLKLQFQSLANSTGALPQVNIPDVLPNRWAKDTTQAIQSGIMHTVLAGIKDFIEAWQAEFGGSKVIITGGDSSFIYQFLYSFIFTARVNIIRDCQLMIRSLSKLRLEYKVYKTYQINLRNMSNYNLNFISDKDIYEHVKQTVLKYRFSINLSQFSKNLIDPIKLTFDSKVYRKSVEFVIESEVLRQIDKSNTNHIGYFHQNIFHYFGNGWELPTKGYDIINNKLKVFVEMKNKHNTMNSSSSQKTYMRMQNTLLHDSEATCLLVEVIAKKKQNAVWKMSLDGVPVSDERIRRVSIDKFYELVTGQKTAFKDLCEKLPLIIQDTLDDSKIEAESNSVFRELKDIDTNLLKSIYLMSFKHYEGFDNFNI